MGSAMTHSPGAPALQIQNLHVSFGAVQALRGISLSAQPGQITALLGPNGAGKTTAISCATGLLRPDRGEVRALGQDPFRADAAHRARVGVMIQDGGLASGARAGQLLRYAASLYAHPLPVGPLAERLGITSFSRTLVRRLSGGQRQRLALALALVGRPELVFLDEPTAGMDPSIRRTVREIIRELAAEGTGVVLTTHLMDDVEGLADHVVVIAAGQVVADGSVNDIIGSHSASDGTVHLSARACGLRPQAAADLSRALRETAAQHGVQLEVTTGAADLESVLLDLTDTAEASRRAEEASP